MKALLFILLVSSGPALAGAEQPNCSRLQDIVVSYDLQLKQKYVSSCGPGLLNDVPIDPALKSELKNKIPCHRLNELEERAKTLENQISLLQGFNILKTEIAQHKEIVGQSDARNAKTSAREFQKSLRIAQSLDLLLNTAGAEPLVRQLKSVPFSRRDSVEKLKNEVSQLCANRQGRDAATLDACSERFTPTPEVVRELQTLLSQSALDDQQIATWRSALQIQKRDGTAWSFPDMYEDFRNTAQAGQKGRSANLSRQIAAIRELPDFQDVDSLPFLKELKNTRSKAALNASLEKFKFSTGDLKGRLENETRSKISWAWTLVKDKIQLDATQLSSCQEAKNDVAKAALCWRALDEKKATLTDTLKLAQINNLKEGIEKSLDYHSSFAGIQACADQIQGLATIPEPLPDCFPINLTSMNLTRLQEELLAVNKIREHIGADNQRLMKFRNFAVEKLVSTCPELAAPSIVDCDEEPLKNISPEALNLTSNMMGLSIVHVPPSEATSVEEECKTSEKAGHEGDLCSFYQESSGTENSSAGKAPDTSQSPYIEPRNQRNQQREAVADGLAGLATGVAQQLFSRPQNYYNPFAYMNPFPYNYSPYPYNINSPADRVMFNARYYGAYGYYFPTVGATPYTAFPVTSPYMQAAQPGASSYFGNFSALGTYGTYGSK